MLSDVFVGGGGGQCIWGGVYSLRLGWIISPDFALIKFMTINCQGGFRHPVFMTDTIFKLNLICVCFQMVDASVIREVCMKHIYDRDPVVAAVGQIEAYEEYMFLRNRMSWWRM